MKKLFGLWLTFLFTFISFAAWGYTPPAAPTDGFLLDQAGVLSAVEHARLRQKLTDINAASQNEIAVLVLNTLDGASIEDVAYTTFNTWGVGKEGHDNGVLLVVAIQDRKMRIETGKGVGGELTDLQSKQILDQHLKPHFKQQQYARGLESGVDAISATLDKRNSGPQNSTDLGGVGWVLLAILGALGLLSFLGFLFGRKARRSYGGYSGGSSSFGSGSSSSGSSFGGFGGGSSGGGGSSDSW